MTSPSPPAERELSFRSIATGVLLGGVLSLCNIYSGLKIGWSFNLSITAALIGFGVWRGAQVVGARPFGKLENNLNQTAASAGASISSAGLVSAIPALTVMTGRTFSWAELALWTFLIGLTGVVVGIGLRRQMIETDRLPFALGIASAETLDKMYASGRDAMTKLKALLVASAAAGALKALIDLLHVAKLALPGSIGIAGARRASMMNLTVGLDPSPLMVAVGALGSLRTGVTMLVGSLFAWLVLAPLALGGGWVSPGADDPSVNWYGAVVGFLLWPGVALMVTSSLTSVAFSWRSIVRTFTGGQVEEPKPDADASAEEAQPLIDRGEGEQVPKRVYLGIVAAVLTVVSIAQVVLFDIAWWAAILAVLLTFVLAAVAGRVSGETTITPVGAMGKVTQLVFGLAVPANPTANLMAANVTGGASSQCADLLHDLKAGSMLGASPRWQALAQACGVIGGATIGSAAYLVLFPRPAEQMASGQFDAPAVRTWQAVAELFARGPDAMPPHALEAMGIAALVGIALTIAEKTLPKKWAAWTPNAPALGLAFVIQAWTSFALFFGSVIGFLLRRHAKQWSEQYLTPVCAGIIAGESLMGFFLALYDILFAG